MTPQTDRRNLLVVAGPEPWVPADGQQLAHWTLHVARCSSLEEAAAHPPQTWDVVAFRVENLRPLSPADSLAALREVAPDATFLPVAGSPDPHEAIFFLKHGAFEYLEEPLPAAAFRDALAQAIENRDTFQEILELNRTLEAQKDQLLREKRELERRNRELEAVSRLAHTLASTLDLDEILDRLARFLHETYQVERVVVGLLDSSGAVEEARAGVCGGKALAGKELAALHCPLGGPARPGWLRTVYERRETLRVADPASHPDTQGSPLALLWPRPFLKIPMVARGRVVGTITLESASEADAVLGIFADTAALAVENARLYLTMRELSVRDELTGLFNRRHFLQRLEAEWNHATRHEIPLTLLLIDIDHFKTLNDGNDHLTGDAALRQLGSLLPKNTRGIDTVARYGGEEFVVLLPRTPRGTAQVVAEKLRRKVEAARFPGEAVLPGGTLTISVGAASYPEDAATPEELVERADHALYQAKAAGRNRVCLWEGERGADAATA